MSDLDEMKSQAAPRCPICRKTAVAGYRPFCSKRCRDIDLAKWLGGGYAIAGAAPELDDEGTPELPDGGSDQA